uniref:Eukaryotic translation initiation factor 4B n=1 Tax=Leptobrachium leishanense TaxID=445787 RepID=A0A8C5PD32_9ANUR
MAASAKKKNKKGKTLTLTDFLANDGSSAANTGGSTYVPKPVSWADETDDLEGDVSTTWHSNDDEMYRSSQIDRSILPTAPRAAREPNVDRSRLPKGPPYTAFLGNLPYDVSEESIQKFFRCVNLTAVRLPREPSNPERLKGFGYAEFGDMDSLLQALSLNEESLGNRRIRVDIADQAQDKDRDDRSFGRDRDRNRDSDKTDSSDWRARPTADSTDDYPPRRGDDSFGGDTGYDSRGGSSRRAFGSGYRRDDDYRSGGDRYGDRYEDRRDDQRRDDQPDKWSSFSRSDDSRREDRGGGGGGGGGGGPSQRPKLNLKPRTAPKEEELSGGSAPSSRAASIFGGAKPVDTAAREREVEERLQKEQEKLQQRHLDDDRPRQLDRKPRERHPSWRSEDNQERSRTGSESSQTGNTGSSTSRISRRRESEKSVENEVFGKDEDVHSPSSKGPKSDSSLPLKVMPAPPPKENAWVKRSTANAPSRSLSSESSKGRERQSDSEKWSSETGQQSEDENKIDGDHTSGRNMAECSKASDKNDQWNPDEENVLDVKGETQAAKFSLASKYAALSIDGEEEIEDYTN